MRVIILTLAKDRAVPARADLLDSGFDDVVISSNIRGSNADAILILIYHNSTESSFNSDVIDYCRIKDIYITDSVESLKRYKGE